MAMTLFQKFRARIRDAGWRPAVAAVFFGVLVPGALLLTAYINPDLLKLTGTSFLGLSGVIALTIGLAALSLIALFAYARYALFKPVSLDALVLKLQQQRSAVGRPGGVAPQAQMKQQVSANPENRCSDGCSETVARSRSEPAVA